MGLGPRSLGPWVTMWRTATPHLHTDLRAGSELLCIKPLLVGFCCDSNSLTQICTESPKAPTRISIWMAFWFFGHTSTGTVFLCQKPFIFPTSHWVLHSAPPFPDTSWIALGNSSPSFSATQSIQVCRQLSMADCFQGSLGREKEVRKLFHWVLKVGVWALCGVRGGWKIHGVRLYQTLLSFSISNIYVFLQLQNQYGMRVVGIMKHSESQKRKGIES